MKKTILAFILFTAFITNSQAQTGQTLQSESNRTITKDPNDTIPKIWKTGGLFSLNIAQGSLSNWAAGGDKFSFALTSYLNGHAFYKKGKNSWDNNLDINLAYVNTTSLGGRKNDDRIDLLSKYGYALSSKWDFGALFDFRSQFFKGYSYASDNSKTLSSAFLSPAYIILGPGFNYHPAKGFSIYISPATIRWIIVNNDSLSAQGAYGVDSGHTVKTQFGAYATVQYTANLNKTVSYTGRLDLYSDYLDKPQNVAFYMTNLFAAKISKVLAVTYSLALIYDDNVKLFGPNHDSPRMQLNSLVGVGLLVKL